MSPLSAKLDFILFIVVLLIALSDCTQRIKRMYAMCPPKFTKIGNECYYVSTERLNWLESHFACKDKNSKLAEPIKYEDRALRKYMLHNDTDKIEKWIGGVYNWERNKWQWGQTGRTVVYQSFSQMDPRSRQDLKYHCAVLNPALKYRWSAKICVEKYQYICQHRMPFVEEINKQKVYDRWNETFPNEKANEIEMFMDQPIINNTRRVKEKRQRIEQRMIRKPLQLNVTHEVYRHVDADQLLHENSIKPTLPTPVNRKADKRRRRPKRRRTTRKPVLPTTPDVPNELGNGRLIIPLSDLGSPIVESVYNDDFYNIVQQNHSIVHSFLPTRPTAAPTKRRRQQRRRKAKGDKQRHKNPRQENETTNHRTSQNEIITEKILFDDFEKSRSNREKLHREKEASRMAEAKRQLEENLRIQEEKKRRDEEKKRSDEEHRVYVEHQMERERELQRERDAYDRQINEYHEEEDRRRISQKQQLKEIEILERERLEEEQQRAEQKIHEKNVREENRRQEELRVREQEDAKRLEEHRKQKELEQKLEEDRLAEEKRISDEQKRQEQERLEAEKLKRAEDEKLLKLESEKQRKRQELLERFKKLSPEQKQEYLKRRRQMKNESTIPE